MFYKDTYTEMNNFILNYIENDKTGRAIMLTGEWGSGKSYYVKNNLKPFLESKKGSKHKCVIISLYGLSNVSEISKAIYMELRSFKFKKKNEVLTTAGVAVSIVPKTVFNAMTSHIGYDMGQVSDKQLQKVYDSINLNGKLLVFEDIERTQMNIIELLGYINNMCENDGVKVLLVTNESELLHYHFEKDTTTEYGKEKTIFKKIYSEKAQKYIKAKEKSISDTLQFYADFQQTMDSIIDKFKNDDLSIFKGCFKTPKHSIFGTDITNYREVIVACQKACDIYNYIETNRISANKEFKKCILIGLIYYLQKCSQNLDLNFKDNTLFDSELSESDIYPLMRFCYDYYNFQIINQEEIIKTIEAYDEYIIYIDKTGFNDKDLKILYAFYTSCEEDIHNAINNIFNRLDDVNDISLSHYGRIINNLLCLKYDVRLNNKNIDEIICKILSNLKGRGAKLNKNCHLFSHTIKIHDTDGAKEFIDIKNKVFESLNYTPKTLPLKDASDYAEMIANISNDNIRQYNPNQLIKKIPLDIVIIFITKFTAETMDNLRHILLVIDYNELSNDTLNSIQTFKNGIEAILNQSDIPLDCIQKYQLRLTCDAIDRNIANNNN